MRTVRTFACPNSRRASRLAKRPYPITLIRMISNTRSHTSAYSVRSACYSSHFFLQGNRAKCPTVLAKERLEPSYPLTSIASTFANKTIHYPQDISYLKPVQGNRICLVRFPFRFCCAHSLTKFHSLFIRPPSFASSHESRYTLPNTYTSALTPISLSLSAFI
jgi:hypothetical protein